MLYLHPPFHILEGIALFPDHEDPRQYYYLPVAPRLVTRPAPDGDPVPQIQLLAYTGEAGSGGFLDLDVDLRVEDEVLDDIRRQLKRLDELEEEPRLAPVPLIDGTVSLILLGHQTGEEVETDEEGRPRFVLNISQHEKPALFGDNRAAFSVELDSAGVAVLEQALQGEMAPVGVVYSLEYLALRPAYNVRVHVDWERVHAHLEEHFKSGFLFASAEVSEVVDEMVEERLIEMEVDTLVAEEENQDILSRRDDAVRELRDMILDGFFEPAPAPDQEEPDGWEKAARTVRSLAVPPVEALQFFRWRNVDHTRIDQRVLNANMRERTTVRRHIHPQGHLAGLFRTLQREGMELDRFVTRVSVDHPFFQRREVEVRANAEFEVDGIESIHVRLDYRGRRQDVLLDSGNPRSEVSWDSMVVDGAMVREVEARYTVHFSGVESHERPTKVESPPTVVRGRHHTVTPRELYSVQPVAIATVANFPWEQYDAVEVECRYRDEANGLRLQDRFVLTGDSREARWDLFILDPERDRYQYHQVFRAKDHRDLELPWTESGGDMIQVENPFSTTRKLTVVPSPAMWSEIGTAFIDLSYSDPENGIREEASLSFTKDQAAPQDFVVKLADPERRRVDYTVTLLMNDGRVEEAPRSFTLDPRLILRRDMKAQRTVHVRPASGDFSAEGLRRLTVDLRHDSEAAEPTKASFTFESPEAEGRFSYELSGAEGEDYKFRITRVHTNGMSSSTDWKSERAEELVIPLK